MSNFCLLVEAEFAKAGREQTAGGARESDGSPEGGGGRGGLSQAAERCRSTSQHTRASAAPSAAWSVNLHLWVSGVRRCARKGVCLQGTDGEGKRHAEVWNDSTRSLPDGWRDGTAHVWGRRRWVSFFLSTRRWCLGLWVLMRLLHFVAWHY